MCSDFLALVLTRRPELKDLLLRPVAVLYNDHDVCLCATKTVAAIPVAAPIQSSQSGPRPSAASRILSIRAHIEGVAYSPPDGCTQLARSTAQPPEKLSTSASGATLQCSDNEPIVAGEGSSKQQSKETEPATAATAASGPSLQQRSDTEPILAAKCGASAGNGYTNEYTSDDGSVDEPGARLPLKELRISSDSHFKATLAALTILDVHTHRGIVHSRRGTYDGVLSFSPREYRFDLGCLPSDASPRASPPASPLASLCRLCSTNSPRGMNLPGDENGDENGEDDDDDDNNENHLSLGGGDTGDFAGGCTISRRRLSRAATASRSLRSMELSLRLRPSSSDGLTDLRLDGVAVSAARPNSSTHIASVGAGSSKDPWTAGTAGGQRSSRRQGSQIDPLAAAVAALPPPPPLLPACMPRRMVRTRPSSGAQGEGQEAAPGVGAAADATAADEGWGILGPVEAPSDPRMVSRSLRSYHSNGPRDFLPSGRSMLRGKRLRSQRCRVGSLSLELQRAGETEPGIYAEAEAEMDGEEDCSEPTQRPGGVSQFLRASSSPGRMVTRRFLSLSFPLGANGATAGDADADADSDVGVNGVAGNASEWGPGGAAERRMPRRPSTPPTPRLWVPAVLELQLQLPQPQQPQQQQAAGGKPISHPSALSRSQSPAIKQAAAGPIAGPDGDASGMPGGGGTGTGGGGGGGAAVHVGRQALQLPIRQPQPPILPYGGVLRLAVSSGSGIPFALGHHYHHHHHNHNNHNNHNHQRRGQQSQHHVRSQNGLTGPRGGGGGGGDQKSPVTAISPSHVGSPAGAHAQPPPHPTAADASSPTQAPIEHPSDAGAAARREAGASSGGGGGGGGGGGSEAEAGTLRLYVPGNSRPVTPVPPPPPVPLLPSLKHQAKVLRTIQDGSNRQGRGGGDMLPTTHLGVVVKQEQRRSFTGFGGGSGGGIAAAAAVEGVSNVGGGNVSGRCSIGSVVETCGGCGGSTSAGTAATAMAVVVAVADGTAAATETRQHRQCKLSFTPAVTAPAVVAAVRHGGGDGTLGRANGGGGGGGGGSLLPVISQQAAASQPVHRSSPGSGAAGLFPTVNMLQPRGPAD